MCSFGVRIADFFDQDITGGRKGKGKSQGSPKGETLEVPQTKGGKSQGKKGSTNKPKEPTPPSKPKEPAAWEEESPGRSPKSLKKVLKKSSDPRAPKRLKKSLGEAPKSLEKVQKRVFRDFSDPPRDFFRLLGPEGPRTFSRHFFQTFGVSARRLLFPGRGDPNLRSREETKGRFCKFSQRQSITQKVFTLIR